MAAVGASVGVAGVLGAIVVVLAGVQSLFGFQTNWTTYRTTAEALRRERHLYLARAGQYAGEDRDTRLALVVESPVSDETTQWAAAQQGARGEAEGPGPLGGRLGGPQLGSPNMVALCRFS